MGDRASSRPLLTNVEEENSNSAGDVDDSIGDSISIKATPKEGKRGIMQQIEDERLDHQKQAIHIENQKHALEVTRVDFLRQAEADKPMIDERKISLDEKKFDQELNRNKRK